MKPDAASQTALGNAAGRAIESCRDRDERLFNDPYAFDLLPRSHRTMVRLLRIPLLGPALLAMRERQIPGIMGNLWCRTRFIDEAVRDAVATGIEQVVILGAGLDTRAYRLVVDAHVTVFVVDHPATQAWKREQVERLDPDRLPQVRFVPVDFDRDDLGAAMTAAGFRSQTRTLFIWEGVTQYLAGEAVDATLRFVSDCAPPGSRLVFTYIDRAIVDGSTTHPISDALRSELERHGEPWRFGIDPDRLTGFLDARGFDLVEDVGADDYRSRYLEPTGRELDLFDGERVAIATVRVADDDRVR